VGWSIAIREPTGSAYGDFDHESIAILITGNDLRGDSVSDRLEGDRRAFRNGDTRLE
jgi:hypothetical protein